MYRDIENGRITPGGTTIRYYDPKIDAWQSVWITPEGNAVVKFVGRKVDDKIVLEGIDPEGSPIR